MEVEIQNENKAFKPFNIIIKVQTEDELNILKELFALDVTIPNLFEGEKKTLVKLVLRKIHNILIINDNYGD